LPAGLRVYATGDVHGHADLLEAALGRIDDEIARDAPADWRIVMLGDYCDRGPHSSDVLSILNARSADPRFVCLRGNHDEWLELFLSDPYSCGEDFLRWGGRETLASYGVDPDAGEDPARLSRALARNFPAEHRRFLASLKLSHAEGDYFFAHAGVRPGVPLADQQARDLMWIRGEFHRHDGSFGAVVIHGHTPVDMPEIRPNRINIDTGAYQSGRLTTLVLEGASRRFLETKAGHGL
jgi:serine/threonine protein phosphatase 1